MRDDIQERIGDYLDAFRHTKDIVNDGVVVAAIIEQVGKDTRCEWMMSERSNGNGNFEQVATEKQLGFLKRLKVDAPSGCTKQEASRLIDEAQAKAA